MQNFCFQERCRGATYILRVDLCLHCWFIEELKNIILRITKPSPVLQHVTLRSALGCDTEAVMMSVFPLLPIHNHRLPQTVLNKCSDMYRASGRSRYVCSRTRSSAQTTHPYATCANTIDGYPTLQQHYQGKGSYITYNTCCGSCNT